MSLDDAEVADDPELAGRLLEARPDGDRLTRSVWLASVTAALFGETRRVTVGRYELVRQLGSGGGGSVYVAHDPELHRDVAIKLIRYASERHRRRALAEARTLARLSHPNVVPMHDVGDTAEHVYLVMELLRGTSLREHAADPARSVRDVVAAYRQAASGLAAAHAVGIVHRDFKPDNAVFGDDERLRVVDFGLASTGGESTVAGTPGYMAPEQRAGTAIDATVDQFALGISLREAFGGRDEPAWLGRVIARATSPLPADRFPSMEALYRELGRDPRTRWKRRALVAVPVTLAMVGFAIGRTALPETETCTGGAESLAPVWTLDRVDAAAARVERLGTPFAVAVAPQVRERARGLGETWQLAYRASCTKQARGELSPELYDRATACLARSRAGIAAAMDMLETADATSLDKAVTALAISDDAERCADPVVLASEAGSLTTPALREIDNQIETAEVHARALADDAVERAARVVDTARVSGDARLLSRSLLVLGHARLNIEDLAGAVAPLHESMRLALANGQDDVMVEAYARHAYVRAVTATGDRLRALDGLELAEIIGRRAGERGAFGRALLTNNVGSVASLGGDFERARASFRKAAAEAKLVHGPRHVELATATSNLAMLTVDRTESARLYEEALAVVEGAVGRDHPDALLKQLAVISERVDAGAVVTSLATACPRVARLHPSLTALIEVCAFELAWQATAIGRRADVLEAAKLSVSGRRTILQQLVAAYAQIAAGTPTKALVDELEKLARAEVMKIDAVGWSQNNEAAEVELALAAAASAIGDAALARRAAASANGHLERTRSITGMTTGLVQRRLAWARELVKAVPGN